MAVAAAMSASARCPHVDVHIHVNCAHVGDSNTKYLEITARCKTCDVPMVFPCGNAGSSPMFPAVNVDGSEIRVPMRAEGEEPEGSQLGYSIERIG